MTNNVLVGKIINELVEAGIEVNLFNKKKIPTDSGGYIAGGFEDTEKILEVAAKRSDWILLLAHEYCHFKQWKQGLFDDVFVVAAYSVFESWVLGKKDLPLDLVESFIRKMQWIEMDNEIRTIELLDSYNVDYDKEFYIKQANIYILSYEMTRRLRKENKKSLYDVEGLFELVSGDEILTEEEFGDLPEGFEQLATECFYIEEDNDE